MKAGGSSTTTSKRSPAERIALSARTASERSARTRSATPLRAALRVTRSIAFADESMQRTSLRSGESALDPPRTGVGVEVEHPPAGHPGREPGPVGAMVVVPAGLLPREWRGLEHAAPFLDGDRVADGLSHDLHARFETLEGAGRRVVAEHDGAEPELRAEEGDHFVPHPLHARGGDLRHRNVAVAVQR